MESSTQSFGKIIEGITAKFDKISADAEASVPVSSNPSPAPTAIPAPKVKVPAPPPSLAKPDGANKKDAKKEAAKAPETPAPAKKWTGEWDLTLFSDLIKHINQHHICYWNLETNLT